MKVIGYITSFLVWIVAGVLVGLLSAYIIKDVTVLYQVPILKDFTFLQFYGFCFIISLLGFKYEEVQNQNAEEKTVTDLILKLFGRLIGKCCSFLLMWWFAYIIFKIIS